MGNLKQYLNVTDTSEFDNYSLEDITFALENIDEDLKVAYSVLDTHNESTQYAYAHGLESLESTTLTKCFPGLESRGGPRGGSALLRFWDDWFTTRHRLIQGIVDLLRKKEKTIAAYRKKLEDKAFKIDENRIEDINKLHEATFISMEKYWLFADGKYPTDILSAVEVDFKDISSFLEETPKEVESSFKALLSVLKSSKGENLKESLDKKASSLKGPIEIIPKEMANVASRYLYRTVIAVGNTEKEVGEGFEKMSAPTEVKVLSGGWGRDALNALLLFIRRTPIYLVASVVIPVRALVSEPFELRSSEIIKLHKLANDYLDNAEKSISLVRDSLEKIDSYTQDVKKTLKDKEVDTETAKMVTGYIANLTKLLEEPYGNLVNRQIKMAKGINYILMRTINR